MWKWLARQLTGSCGWDELPRYLIRDRDGAYGAAFSHPGHGHSRPTGLGAVVLAERIYCTRNSANDIIVDASPALSERPHL
jgi:hypothetical protein